ncbi:uncharacterized protein MELLADRAFT_116151 [Melampsora larici-populina 98AG31]|uniref:2Fe-2S ferredoxin-type domain-containing protein n=1 Tax=Melampsora larici-populina (strain 98AG31 / pathotype 3-4-7) TaxID=747676 RepID=F4RI59_MELLP|nr:uncharacterized protein MELLADRAFT_116151 [Melampsora larici-populina 98AG31]EGG08017.1 hypothetical protein MELLADRAFT_116151 [Melampsora larici-populina 98AG31]
MINLRIQSTIKSKLKLQRLSYTTTSSNQPTFASTCTATVPSYTRHLILHHQSISESNWPSDLTTISPLYKTLQNLTKPGQSLHGLGLSLSTTSSRSSSLNLSSSLDSIQEAYLHSSHHTIRIPFTLSNSNLDEFIEFYKSLPTIDIKNRSKSTQSNLPLDHDSFDSFYVYVCVHENRDCRCGIRGKPLLESLKTLYQTRISQRPSKPIYKFYPISHIGGHKYAGNLLVYPTGNWFGLLDPMVKGDDEKILNCLLSLGTENEQIWWDKWRGRIGLDKEVQWDVYQSGIKNLNKHQRSQNKIETLQGPDVIVRFKTYEGEVLSLKVAKRGEAPSIEATCGGNCECATCQIYIDETAPIPPPNENEEDMLFTAIDRRDQSRLACQVVLTHQLADWLESQTDPRIQLPRF